MKPKFPTKYIAFTQYFSSSHPAVDIPNKVTVNGTKYDNKPVYMTYDAKVITNTWASDYGYYVEYEYYMDGNRYVVGDGHFDKKSDLKVGQTYPQGTFISNMGNSGKSTAIHDHHRLSKNGTRVDPLKYEYVYPDQIVGSLEKAKLMYYTPEPTPPTPTPSGDAQIRYIQTRLNERYGTNLDIDGKFGPQTKKGLVLALQKEDNWQYGAGLKEDGIMGTNTAKHSPIVRYGADGWITWTIQCMLYCKGFDPEYLDGKYEDKMEIALKNFQRSVGLKDDGVVGYNTYLKLYS